MKEDGTLEVLFFCRWCFTHCEGIFLNREKSNTPSDSESTGLTDSPLSLLLAGE